MGTLSRVGGVGTVALLDAATTLGPILSWGFADAVTFDPEPAHVVGTGGAIGAILRHWVSVHLESERFPWSTLAVNVVGSFVLGLLVFAGASETTMRLLGIGVCGAFTTFSTFSVETVQLWERGNRRLAVGNAAGTLVLSLAGIAVAWLLVGGPV